MSRYSDTLAWLFGLEVDRMDLKLERTAEALRLVGSPHLRFPSIHLAGTNGKGSTAAFLHAMLCAGGYRAGLFTSPHLIDFCERIRVGERRVTQYEVVDALATIGARIESHGIRLTPFEMMTVLAFDIFARAAVDVAVVEVGMGGRLDATNVLVPLVSIITSIGLDHQQYLGESLVDIAREKGGIIKPGVPVVLGPLASESREMLSDMARDRASPTLIYGVDFTVEANDTEDALKTYHYHGPYFECLALRPSLNGSFQARNAAVAVAGLEAVRDTYPVSADRIRTGVHEVCWPGRLQVVSGEPLVVLDGAHNIQAMETLLAELPGLLPGRRLRFLFGVMRDKDWQRMAAAVERVAAEVVVTAVASPRAADPDTVRAAFSSTTPTRVICGAPTAFEYLVGRAEPGDAVVVCGSLFLVGEVLRLLPESVITPPASSAARLTQRA